jgi:hypothetical protein
MRARRALRDRDSLAASLDAGPPLGHDPAMPNRLRKLVGGLGLVVFVVAYAALAVTVAGWLPPNALVKLAYFLVVGVAWGGPVIPLIAWMNRGR